MTDLSGKTLKGYQIGDCIGIGGQGAVYRARETAINREVAIKVILPKHANEPDFIRGFETEAQLIARLEHPHITPLYTYWREPNGAYLVMRYVYGGSLDSLIESGPLPLETIARYLDQITDALAFAHKNNVVHRDLKPGNILIDRDDNAYLTDFGIAVGIGRGATTDSVSGTIMYMSPEQLDNRPAAQTDDIYSLGIVLYEMLTGTYPYGKNLSITDLINKHLHEPAPDLPDHLPHGLNIIVQKAMHKDRNQRFSDTRQIAALFNKIVAGEVTPAPDTVILQEVKITNPYKGLRAFQQADAPDFYGRQALVDRLLERLAETSDASRFLAVVGPSGSGKSSVVRAGLLPALQKGELDGSDQWFMADMIPGPRPLDELEVALTRIAAKPGVDIMTQLQRDEHGLHRLVGMLLPDDGELFLMIDQFEEVYTVVQEDDRRKHFLALIGNAVSHPRSRVRVSITLRADFYDRPLTSPELSELVRQRTEVVVPLTPEELEQAISRPAEHVGMKVEPALVAAMVAEVSERPGTLPLLQYSLTELFDRREDNTLSMATYNQIGGVMGALTRRADELFSGLDDAQQEVMRQIFMRLVTLGEGTEDLRRRVLFSEIASINADMGVSGKLLDRFANYRLLTMDHDPTTQEATVEVAHEALIREWRTLRGWLDESRDDIRLQRMLATATKDWQTANQEPSYLLTGARITQFNAWVHTTDVALTDDERQFLESSINEEQRRQARRRMIRNVAIAITAMVTLILAALTMFAFGERGKAQNSANNAETQAAIAQLERDNAEDARATSEANILIAQRQLDVNQSLLLANDAEDAYELGETDLALALALEAVDIEQPPPEAEQMLNDIAMGPGLRAILNGGIIESEADTNFAFGMWFEGVAFSPDGRLALSNGCRELDVYPDNNDLKRCVQGELILWDLGTGAELRRFRGQHDWYVAHTVAFSPDGALVAAIICETDRPGCTGTLVLWDAATGEEYPDFPAKKAGFSHFAFSPDSQTILTGSFHSNMFRQWDVTPSSPTFGELKHVFRGDFGEWLTMDFSPNGRYAVFLSELAGIRVLNIDEASPSFGEEICRYATSGYGRIVFALDGSAVLFVRGFDLVLLDIETCTEIRQHTFASSPLHLNISADGRMAVFRKAGGRLYMWDIAQWQEIYSFSVTGTDWASVALSQDGRSAIIAQQGILRLYDLQNQVEMGRFQGEGTELKINTIDVSPDGRMVVAGTGDGQGILWEVGSGTEIRRFEGDEIPVMAVDFSPDGQTILISSGDFIGGTDKNLVLWDTESGDQICRFVGDRYRNHIFGLQFSPDGRTALTGSVGISELHGDLILWNLETCEMIHQFDRSEAVMDIVFSADGKRAFTADHYVGNVSLWDVDASSPTFGEKLREFQDISDAGVIAIALSADDQAFLSGGGDGGLILWDVESGEVIRRFIGHDAQIWGVDTSPDGRYALSSSEDTTVRLWDLETSQELRRFEGHSVSVGGVVFAPDGQTAFSASMNGTVIQWRVAQMTLDEVLTWIDDNRYVREITCDERTQYNIAPLCDEGEE